MARGITVHLIRHEKTRANVERKYIGWTDESILQEVSAQLTIAPTVVYGSDLIRCQQTAACYFPNANYVGVKQLRESNFGDFEMHTYEQLKNQPIYRAWIDDPYEVTPPNGEHFWAFEQRVLQAFQQLIVQQGTFTFVVHGGVIRLLLSHFGQQQQLFQNTLAKHRVLYTLHWDQLEQFLGGAVCTSFSEAPITVNETM
ncbi:fructose-2,6-bisphosphatase [Solibacillus sp. R5-41]|uniref:histidine phosphatase family protein n=1 Tax=Solibacillus sp. R5-41 TaxID=2048654 RepID=UPI000C12575C|nr:histidine phosphatase family protein [Solibacillus sp. R5-41]ATP39531.1 fructose-2,6-bisphosphatase [Solibacillus sp. R5-41]